MDYNGTQNNVKISEFHTLVLSETPLNKKTGYFSSVYFTD
jgi:hypothetical protein